MPLYRKRPVTVEAIRYTGKNFKRIRNWIGSHCATLMITKPTLPIVIMTLEGHMLCRVGDWVIKGIHGEFYPCKNEIFKKTYERVRERDEK